MASRKTSTKNNFLDPISLRAIKAVKVAADYHRLGNTTEPATLLAAWNKQNQNSSASSK